MNTNLDAIDVMKRMREMFSVTGSWCRGVMAEDKEGQPVDPNSVGAIRFCLLGALRRVTELQGSSPECWKCVRDELACSISEPYRAAGIDRWNDEPGRTRQEILGLLDSCIERLRRREELLSLLSRQDARP